MTRSIGAVLARGMPRARTRTSGQITSYISRTSLRASDSSAGVSGYPGIGVVGDFASEARRSAACSFIALRQRARSVGRPFGIALVEELRVGHPVGAEAAEVGAQLAPGDQQPHRLVVADRDRPDGALGWPAPARRGSSARSCGPARIASRTWRHVEAVRRDVPARAPRGWRARARTGRSRSGTAAPILAIRSCAARASAGSPRPATHWAPSTAASISSGVSISGGMSKPPSST